MNQKVKENTVTGEASSAQLNPRKLMDMLFSVLNSYLPQETNKIIQDAFEFAFEAHKDQKRKSGEPFITHPISVAIILANMHMDPESIIAAVLHDVMEDSPTPKGIIISKFGQNIADLVDGVTKLTKIKFEDKEEAQAENFRKMVLAMADDIRVILIKLADRLHNMRTIGSMRIDKRKRISKETLEIYAPVANRLGMNTIRVELEDLCFQAIYPMRYRVLKERVKRVRGNRKEIIQKIGDTIESRLNQENTKGRVVGRQKHIYSLYKKMADKGLSFAEVLDVFAFRVVVDSVDTCYRTLGSVHNLYKPVPGRFKDYIAIPKANGYQSLHTVLFGPRGVPIEIQIRSEDMQRVADAGIAAHWLYKSKEDTSNGSSAQARAREWVRGLLEMQQSSGSSLEFIESVKIDLFPDQIYIFTPNGDIIELPRGSTPVDFAYAVHSHIGDTCLAAKVDRRLIPLRTALSTGQTVEIISAPGTKPNAAWLDFVVSAKARSAIRHHLKRLKQDDAIALGRRLIDKAFTSFDKTLEDIPESDIAHFLDSTGLGDLDELFESIGLGKNIPILVAKKLVDPTTEVDTAIVNDERRSTQRGKPLHIKGNEGMVISFARCCFPIPGDEIVGFASSGRGVVVHRRNCNNVTEFRKQPEKWVDVTWGESMEKVFPVNIRLDVTNQRGVLGNIAVNISDIGGNIVNVNVEENEKEGMIATLHFTIAVKNRVHLAQILKRLRVLKTVIRVFRVGS